MKLASPLVDTWSCTMLWLLLGSTLAVLPETEVMPAPLRLKRHHRLLPPIEGRSRALFEQAQVIKEAIDPKLGTELTLLLLEQEEDGNSANAPTRMDGSNRLLVDIAFSSPINNAQAASLLGTKYPSDAEDEPLQVINCYGRVCSVQLFLSQLSAVAQVDAVQIVRRVAASTDKGLVTSEGAAAMYSDLATAQFQATGRGIRIGVISDSYDCLNQANDDIRNGDLPLRNDIRILEDFGLVLCRRGSDEGRAMMQLIHDVAPGAQQVFRTGSRGIADFAAGIVGLATRAGCDVIVDDLFYSDEPFFQDGILSQAIDKVVSQYGIPYFTAGGNRARNSWEAPAGFDEVTVNGMRFHRFGTDGNGNPIITQRITVRNTEFSRSISFQWNDPFYSVSGRPGAQSDLDVLLLINGEVVVSGSDKNIGRNPLELVSFTPSEWSNNATVTVELAITLVSGPAPTYLKYVVFGQLSSIEFATNSPTSVGHKQASLGVGVAAAYWNDTPAFGVSPPVLETFSSVGGSPILFDTDGNRLASPEIRQQPRFTGPDGGINTFFGANEDGVFRFYGTSAAAPHVAAVAALLLELNGGPKSLTPSEIYSILETTAIDMDDNFTLGFDSGYDFATGWGFVNASAALNSLGLPPLPPTPAPVCGFLGLGLFCLFSQCGVFGRLLGLCLS